MDLIPCMRAQDKHESPSLTLRRVVCIKYSQIEQSVSLQMTVRTFLCPLHKYTAKRICIKTKDTVVRNVYKKMKETNWFVGKN